VLKPSAPYNGPVCIRTQGSATCPDGWPVSLTLYSSGIDERVCSACACDPSAVQCEGGTYTFYDANDCVPCDPSTGCTAEVTVGPDVLCVDLTSTADDQGFSMRITSPAKPAHCAASGALPSGQIKVLGETTVCCRTE
jgi:hypothetical protein